ncbi:MAG: LptE family protein [Bacteroidota bacterium]
MKRAAFTGLLILTLFISGCGIYSFNGASIPAEAKTVSIQYFPNYAPMVQPTLSQTLTDALQTKFTSQTRLTLVEKGGDLAFEGSITGYNIAPTAITSNEMAALQRLTVTIKVKYTNKFDDKQNFESSFTRYADYEATKSLSAVEDELIKQINDQLVDDIFNRAVVNW